MNKSILDVNDVPSIQKWIPLSLQHLFAMFGATVLVPLITGLNVQTALLTSGLGTLLFLFITRGQVPNYVGSSFAFIGPIGTVAASQGYGAAMLGALLAGLVYVVIAMIVKFIGINWLDRLLPPVVIGSIIAVIGLSLAGVAVGWAVSDPLDLANNPYSLGAFEVAVVTFLIVVIAGLFFKGFISVIPVLMGMIFGYGYAWLRFPEWFSQAPLVSNGDGTIGEGVSALNQIAEAKWFAVPSFLTGDLFAAMSNWESWVAAIVIVPVALVTLAEHIGHLLVTGSVMERDLMKKPGLHRTLVGDGLATSLAAFLGGPPNTTYGENISVLAITRVYSKYVIGLAAVFAILFSFIGKLGAVLGSIPKPVLGGVTIVLFGIIAAQGLRMFVDYKIDFANKRNMILTAIILITGIGGFKMEFDNLSVQNIIMNLTIDNIAMATFLGIILHAVLPNKEAAYGNKVNAEKLDTIS